MSVLFLNSNFWNNEQLLFLDQPSRFAQKFPSIFLSNWHSKGFFPAKLASQSAKQEGLAGCDKYWNTYYHHKISFASKARQNQSLYLATLWYVSSKPYDLGILYLICLLCVLMYLISRLAIKKLLSVHSWYYINSII